MTKSQRRTVFAARICFVLYLCFLVYILFLMDERSNTYHQYNLIPFKSIRMFFEYYFIHHDFSFEYWFTNVVGNILLFLPFGILLPVILTHRLGALRFLLASLFLAIAIELIQYYTGLGELDIDDVILNVLGAMIGYWLITHIGTHLSHHHHPKRK
ncbi:MAG: VanZ family protein [Firmicutes bacterium]|nr:VanZ family protein [Bacillota bacterium]